MLSEKFYLTILLLISICSTIIYNRSTAVIKSNRLPPTTVKRTASKGLSRVKKTSKHDEKKKKKKPKKRKKSSSSRPTNKKPPSPTIPTNISQEKKIQKSKNNPVNKTIIVKNNITNNMLAYKHWSGTYEPSFSLTVNGKKIKQGKQKKIPVKGNILKVKYDYSFAKGMQKGTKIVSCNLNKDAKDVSISFSWNSEWHIKTDHAQPQKIENVAFLG